MTLATLRAAACHASPVFLSARGTTDKCISLIRQAASNKARLVVFPETYISAFPVWSAIRPPTENHDLFHRMAQESIYADGEEINAIRSEAKKSGVYVSLGISEKAHFSSATLWNSNLIIGPGGDVLNHHRKLVATFFEKLTWSHGDGHGLSVVETPFGKIGNLICGENTNPLARYSLMAQGEQIHISSWPSIWPTRQLSSNSANASQNYDNVAANKTRAAAHCFEAKCFGIVNSGFLDEAAFKVIQDGASDPQGIMNTLQASQRAATMYLDPTGSSLPAYTIDASGKQVPKEYLQNEEGILYADMNVRDTIEGKQYHDVVGGYQRLDVFDLQVDRSRRDPVTFVEEQDEPELPVEFVTKAPAYTKTAPKTTPSTKAKVQYAGQQLQHAGKVLESVGVANDHVDPRTTKGGFVNLGVRHSDAVDQYDKLTQNIEPRLHKSNGQSIGMLNRATGEVFEAPASALSEYSEGDLINEHGEMLEPVGILNDPAVARPTDRGFINTDPVTGLPEGENNEPVGDVLDAVDHYTNQTQNQEAEDPGRQKFVLDEQEVLDAVDKYAKLTHEKLVEHSGEVLEAVHTSAKEIQDKSAQQTGQVLDAVERYAQETHGIEIERQGHKHWKGQ